MLSKMFGKQVGYYHFSSLYRYLVGSRKSVKKIKNFLPKKKHVYYFAEGRQAIFSLLKYLREEKPNLKVAIPAWACSIIYSALEFAQVETELIDIQPSGLKMDINEILSTRPDVVILVAENGTLYNKEEVEILNQAGIITIGDYCLALQNYKIIRDIGCHYDIFSGGFSKPISSLGVGILCTDSYLELTTNYHSNLSIVNFTKLIVHLFIQHPIIYNWVANILGDPRKEQFVPATNNKVNWRHLDVLANELEKFRQSEKEWAEFQTRIQTHLDIDDIDNKVFRSKLLIPIAKIKSNKLIHFHKQYQWTTELSKLRNFPGMESIQADFFSFAINRTAFNKEKQFLTALNCSLNHDIN